jgi:biotin carboxyl carrier protein
MSWEVSLGDQVFAIEVEPGEGSNFVVTVDGEAVAVDACFPESDSLHLILGGEAYEFDVQRTDRGQDVTLYGTCYSTTVLDERSRALRDLGFGAGAASGNETISTSMPGKVVAILVEEGQEVCAGEGIIVIEAMKMENELRCAADGRVQSICVAVGDTAPGGAALVKLAPREDA